VVRGGVLAVAAVAMLGAAAGCASVTVQSRSPAEPVAVATALLAHGAASWNAGDLDGFMADYADSATFVTSQGLVHGRPAIQARYAPRFRPGAVRDSLWFRDIAARWEGDGIQAVAWWHLSRGDSLVARGPTSLLLRRVDGHWRIVHDHSS
jgi:ketosteroid isomerase-like protein